MSAVAPDGGAQTLGPDLPLAAMPVGEGFRTRWYRNRSFVAGLIIVGVIIGLCTFAPLLTPYSPTQQDLTNVLQPPSAQHWLGTDQLGIDMWSQLLYGGRTDLRIAFLAVILPFILGTTLGCLAGLLRAGRGRRRDARRRHRRGLPLLRADHRAGVRIGTGRARHLHRHHHRGLGVLRAHPAR